MKILFVCTHNRCRSILSEAIARHRAGAVLDVRSAGSQPAGEVHPLSLHYLAQAGYPTEGLQSQSWDEFADFAPDLVITVCDAAAGEACPLYLGNSMKVHWGLSDPSKIEGNTAEQAAAFSACIAEVERRVDVLAQLACGGLQGDALRTALAEQGAK
ncbi:arsenate reductase ArsC [Parahaliea aestuarii]|uniref:Arsenate reductase ArsC n=1 Tax=Parahaliea aestuarii TaxID=1852021 RepID=A0A5C9A5L5_9GAMM|nr:arsenate reductase ArsC [Parahaliea aestuarii]TXS94451.1 arsenate reductase ArsC [Parahaliea aestuarii]